MVLFFQWYLSGTFLINWDPKRRNETTNGNKAGYSVCCSCSVPKISVKLLHTILSTISLIFLGKIRTNLPQRIKEKLNVHCRATRPCFLLRFGNTRILQSFTTGTACSHYQSASNLYSCTHRWFRTSARQLVTQVNDKNNESKNQETSNRSNTAKDVKYRIKCLLLQFKGFPANGVLILGKKES